MRRAAARNAATGSQGSTPSACAVAGKNWAMPSAPAGDNALGLKPLSALICRTYSVGEMPAASASWAARVTKAFAGEEAANVLSGRLYTSSEMTGQYLIESSGVMLITC